MPAIEMVGLEKTFCAATAISSVGMREGAGLPHTKLMGFFSSAAGNKPMMLKCSSGGDEIVGSNSFADC